MRGAATRGPHGWGVARWMPSEQAGLILRGQGNLVKRDGSLQHQASPGVVVGQCRLATSGGPAGYADAGALQPLACNGLAIAHNGNVYNASELVGRYRLRPRTSNDSEVVGLLLAWALRGGGDLLHEAAAVLNEITSPLALLALLPDGGVLAATRGLPLHVAVGRSGGAACYLGSRPLPESVPLPSDSITHLRRQGGRVIRRAAPLSSMDTPAHA